MPAIRWLATARFFGARRSFAGSTGGADRSAFRTVADGEAAAQVGDGVPLPVNRRAGSATALPETVIGITGVLLIRFAPLDSKRAAG